MMKMNPHRQLTSLVPPTAPSNSPQRRSPWLRRCLSTLVLLACVQLPQLAQAEIIHVSLGIPISASAGDEGLEGVSGIRLGVGSLLFPVSLTFEQYQGARKVALTDSEQDETDFKVANQMVGLFYTLPIPVIDLGLGIAVGSATLTPVKDDVLPTDDVYKSASLFGYSAYLGWPIFPFTSIFLAYHVVQGEAERKDDAQPVAEKLPLDGDVAYLGLNIGF